MPQMVALFNGMGGGSAAAIGAVELLRLFVADGGRRPSRLTSRSRDRRADRRVSLTGSVIAWAKLDGRMDKRYTFPASRCSTPRAFAAVVCGGCRCRRWRAVDHRVLRRSRWRSAC
jgi:NAD(P) transhydrogenase subunit beta